MSGINSIVGLNTVPVDFRPEIDPAEKNNAPAVNENQLAAGEPDEGLVRPSASGIVRELDVLLLNAAGKSVAADTAQNVKTIGETLQGKGVLTKEEAAKLQALAKDASDKLKALDGFTGAQLAEALVPDKTKALVWRKGLFSMNQTAKAVKAAVEAQEALSQALEKFNRRLATHDAVDLALQEQFMELQFQADRRATEIHSVVVRMYDLAQKDVVNGINADPKIKALFSATFSDLMPREAIMMHGTAEALALMNNKLGKEMRPLAEKLEAFKAGGARILEAEEIATLESDMLTMKNALADVRKNGIEMGNGTLEVDKSLLDAMEKVLDDAAKDIAAARATAALKVRAEFVNDVQKSFSLELTPEDKAVLANYDGMHGMLNNFFMARNVLVKTLAAVADGKIPNNEANQRINNAALIMQEIGLNPQILKALGFSENTAKNVCDHIDTLFIIKSQFHEMMKKTQEFATNGVGGATSGFDVRRIFLGEVSLSSAVDAKIRGFRPEDVNPATDDANVADSALLGRGVSGSTYLVTTKGGEEFVFKPELEGRLGLGHLVIANGTAFSMNQTTANLNLATQDAAKMLGCEDVVVKYSVGNHNGQFGVFMEKAKGATGYQFANKANVVSEGGVNPSRMKKELKNNADNAQIRGKVAQKLNRLQWLDMISGQMDRHWENYFIHIDKATHEVTLKGIDCDASFTTFRTGLQKYALDKFTSDKFRARLPAVCNELHSPDTRTAEYEMRVKNDPGITWHDDGRVTVDVSRVKSPEVVMALQSVLGSQSLAIPEVMDEDVYNHLMEIDSDPAKKQAYLDSIAPRLSAAAFAAARTRLDDAIAYAKALKDMGHVYGDEEWKSPLKVRALEKMQKGVTITRHDGSTIYKSADDSSYVNLYTINTCPSYFNRDFLDKELPR